MRYDCLLDHDLVSQNDLRLIIEKDKVVLEKNKNVSNFSEELLALDVVNV